MIAKVIGWLTTMSKILSGESILDFLRQKYRNSYLFVQNVPPNEPSDKAVKIVPVTVICVR